MNCEQCRQIISDYVDGSLELGEQVNIERHLSNCEPCRAVRDDLLQIVQFSHQLPLHTPSGELWSRIREDIAEEARKTSPLATLLNKVRFFSTRYLNLSMTQLAGATAAVIIAVGAFVFF